MAVDTRDRRFSMLSIANPWRGPSAPNPDGALNQGDRQELAWLYSGINAGTDLPPTGGTRRRRISLSLYGYYSPPQTVPITLPIVSFED